MSAILVTGFEPFGGDAINPSGVLAQALDGHRLGRHRIVARVLPVAFDDGIAQLGQAIDAADPDLVLGLGLAAGRAGLSFERVAVNLIDAVIADNAGLQPIDRRVLNTARDAWLTNLPVKAMLGAARATGLRTELSLSAGSYVCNALFFALMHRIAQDRRRGRLRRGGFAHVSLLPPADGGARSSLPTTPLADLRRGVIAALDAGLKSPWDLGDAGGAIA